MPHLVGHAKDFGFDLKSDLNPFKCFIQSWWGMEWVGGRDTIKFVFWKNPFGFYVENQAEGARVHREEPVLLRKSRQEKRYLGQGREREMES